MTTQDWNVPTLLDHTVLRPDATKVDVLRLCLEAKESGFAVIFVPPVTSMRRLRLWPGRIFASGFQSDSH
ncbi:hypothetical protein EMGBD2_17310 [Nitrospirota bacterium]|nr:hypothetical protein EMGBD2_17310 [Nitrospirota bacterium]